MVSVFVVFRGQSLSPVLLASPACQRAEEDITQHSSSLPDIKNSVGIPQDPIVLSVKSLRSDRKEEKAEVG